MIAYLVNENENCPEWNASFGAYLSQLQNTYVVGMTSGVSLQNNDESVTISYEFPGVANNISEVKGLMGCLNKLKASVFSNGDVVDFNGNVLSGSRPINAGFYQTEFSNDSLSIGYITSGGILNLGGPLAVKIPEYVRSLTRKPDTGLFYGIIGEGQVVNISISAGVASVINLTASNCPFAVDNCMVPAWMQSISAGFSSELYGLDHGGNIYSLQSSGAAVSTGDSVSPAVTQVSYY